MDLTSRSRRRIAFGAALAVGALSLTGCSADKLTTPCAVVVDGSGSGAKFDAATRLKDRLNDFAVEQKCGQLAFVPIDGAPVGSVCTQKTLPMDPDLGGNSDQETVRTGRRTLALTRANAMLECARQNPSSDVLGALRRAADQRPPGDGTYQVLVVSDMLQNAGDLSLYKMELGTEAAMTKAVDTVAAQAPKLAGMRLDITDCGVTLSSSKKAVEVKTFWTRLFKTAAVGDPEVDFER